jgi:hypothetical protein
MSCVLTASPRPLTISPFSVTAVCFVILFDPQLRSSTLLATTTLLAFCHGPPSRLSWAPPVGPFGQVPHAEAAAEAPRGPWARPELFCESPTAKAGPGIQLNEHTQDDGPTV